MPKKKEKEPRDPVRVRAVLPGGKYGFYGMKRRVHGEEFEVDYPRHVSPKWMERLDGKGEKAENRALVESEEAEAKARKRKAKKGKK